MAPLHARFGGRISSSILMLARVLAAAPWGIDARAIHIEVDLRLGLPQIQLVGLPDAAVRESRERVRSAVKNCGFELPPRSVIINLAPADVKKEGNHLDLAIAVAFLEASLPEEIGKILVIYYFLLRHEDVRRPLDVVALSIVVSLGFASIENIYYVFGSADWSGTAMVRAVTAIPMHSTMGIIMGYYGAQYLTATRSKRRSLLLMFLWPTVLHGLYDYPVFAVQRLYDNAQGLAEAEALEFQIVFIMAIVATGLVAVHAVRSLTKTPAYLAALPLGNGAASGPSARSDAPSLSPAARNVAGSGD